MSNLLILGKELPDSLELAETFSKNNRVVFSHAKLDSEYANFEAENIYSTTINRASAISAHSFIINAETKLKSIDEVLIIFDASFYNSKFGADKTEDIALSVDTMINNYLFFTNELIKRIDQCKEKITVSFLIKTVPSKYDNLTNSTKINTLPTSNTISMAQNAFISLAENFSTYVQDRPYLSVLLAKAPYNSEVFQNDKDIATWLCASFDAIKSAKHNQTFKQAGTWNKVGTKVSTGFSIFK